MCYEGGIGSNMDDTWRLYIYVKSLFSTMILVSGLCHRHARVRSKPGCLRDEHDGY
jgi:hypothetical protein